MIHGRGGYTNKKCRCDICTNEWRLWMQEYMDTHPEQRDKARDRAAERRKNFISQGLTANGTVRKRRGANH